MNDCTKIQEMISEMLDGELSEKDLAEVKAHIAICPDCAAMYADFAALSEGMDEMYAEVPAALHDNIMKAVRSAPKPKKGLLISLRPYMSAAACLVVVIGAVLAFRGGRSFDMAEDALASPASAPAAACDMPAAAAPEFYLYGQTEKAASEEVRNSSPTDDSPAETVTEMPADMPAEVIAEEAAAEPAAPAESDTPADNSECGSVCTGDIFVPEIITGDPESLSAHFLALFDIECTANDIEFFDGIELENVYIAFINDSRDRVEVRRIINPEALISLLQCRDTEITDWPMYSSAIVEFEYMDDYYCFPLYFDGENIIVTTVERAYYAVGTVEDLLGIK